MSTDNRLEYRVVDRPNTWGGFRHKFPRKYYAQVKRFGVWWNLDWEFYKDRAVERCRYHAIRRQPAEGHALPARVINLGKLP